MIEGRHTEAEALLDFLNDPSTLSFALQMELSRHLTSGCEECWAAVEVLPPVATRQVHVGPGPLTGLQWDTS